MYRYRRWIDSSYTYLTRSSYMMYAIGHMSIRDTVRKVMRTIDKRDSCWLKWYDMHDIVKYYKQLDDEQKTKAIRRKRKTR